MIEIAWDSTLVGQVKSVFGAMADALGEMFFTNLPDGSCDYVSQRFASYIGMPEDRALGFGWASVIHPDDLARVETRWRESVQTGSPFEDEYRLRDAAAVYRWFLVRKVPLHDAHGQVLKWLGTCTDITEFKRAEAARARLAAIVESSEDAIVGKSLDGAIQSWNAAALRLYGYAASEVLGKPVALLVPDEKAAELQLVMERLGRGEHVPPFETVRVRKDGGRVEISLSISPVLDESGALVGASEIGRDMTAHRRLEEQYRQSQKMDAIGRLAGGLAHDFNNLLTVMTSYAHLVLTELAPQGRLREMVAEIAKASERAALLTRQLLAFSRKQVLAPRVLDLNALISDMEKMLQRLLGEDIVLATDLLPTLGRVRADPVQVQQVVLNLAVNARDALPQGGKLTIETTNIYLDESYAQVRSEVRPGPYVLLAVTDNGCGMTPDVLARVFEPFFTTKELGKGTGLGLATVFGIVKQSGGHIAVYSEPGVGTTFKVYLPRIEAPVPPTKSYHGVRVVPRGTETVLVVEDEDLVRRLTKQILESCGYDVLVAGGGEEALCICQLHPAPIHLLVTDVVMPEMGGRRVADATRALHPEMRVLYLSGYTEDAIVRHGVLQEEANFLQKPFSPGSLAEKVREVLDAKLPPESPHAQERLPQSAFGV